MKKNDVYGYIRVSDTKQIDGASLSAQKKAINDYAQKNRLNIIKWFEESKTAAKRGRPKFTEMLSLLKCGKASGVIIHKIDRSARNLHDWASVGDLIDNGIQVHFAHESLDMTERGGRLSADIQAVMASDYVRNLRQETIKGINGRLNQGIYPFCAPIGYLNTGKGKLKEKDPNKYELVQKLFNLYSTAEYSAKDIAKVITQMGLRNHNGNVLNRNSVLSILKNPFYIGILKVNEKLFSGKHETIIDKEVFYRVQDILKGRIKRNGVSHNYLFRRKVKCNYCNYTMSGENQKGQIYYRCSIKNCLTKTVREDYLEKSIKNKINNISLNKKEESILKEIITELESTQVKSYTQQIQNVKLDIGKFNSKSDRLLEAYLDNIIPSEEYQRKKNKITENIHNLNLKLESLNNPKQKFSDKIKNFLELSKSFIKPYNLATIEQKRKILEITTSNFVVSGKSLCFSLRSPFKELLNNSQFSKCTLSQDTHRKTHPNIPHLDNFDVVIANKWVTLLNRPSLNRKQLMEWCHIIDEKFDNVPTIDEFLYPDYLPNNIKN